MTLPEGIEIPTTDKGSLIRLHIYRVFEWEIDMCYAFLENEAEGTMELDVSGFEKYLVSLGKGVVGPELSDPYDDLFTLE